ncbi:hypothetical protein ACU21_06460 [Actinobaculum suis]|nr:hypothetical protein ACU21_06460 [Actinobaculum suis]
MWAKIHAKTRGLSRRLAGTIRQRVALAMIAFVAFVVGAVGIATVWVEYHVRVESVQEELDIVAHELRILAEEGINPETGGTFTGPSTLLQTFMSRKVVSTVEGEVGLLNGEVAWVSGEIGTIRPEDDPELIAHVATAARGDRIVKGKITTATNSYFYTVIPVHFSTTGNIDIDVDAPGHPSASTSASPATDTASPPAAGTQSGALLHVHLTSAVNSEIFNLIRIYVLVAVCAIALSSLGIGIITRRLTQPIDTLREAAEQIEEKDLNVRVPVQGSTDVAQLSQAMNSMLDRLEISVTNQQNLLDDVGHELRTPITIVRGHLELVDPHDPKDVQETRDLALDELDRMAELVSDLLLLAKSKQPGFIQLQATDTDQLTRQVFEKARALGERNWQLTEVAEITAPLDTQRLTQAWLQLAANAVKYSQPGSRIEIGSRTAWPRLHLFVRDEGRGIPRAEIQNITGRFTRGSTAAGADGAGLGLAIVQSIVTGHGGRLAIESEVGKGSLFTIMIPYAGTAGTNPGTAITTPGTAGTNPGTAASTPHTKQRQ